MDVNIKPKIQDPNEPHYFITGLQSVLEEFIQNRFLI